MIMSQTDRQTDKYLSIIIPIYNMEKYLPECLSSLQKQNFADDVEILLIDDGSTDNSSKICDKVAQEDTHYRVIHQKNQGVATARNRGLQESKGEYIAWVDPDDYITDDWWKILQPVLAKNPDMVYFDRLDLLKGKFIEQHFDKSSRIITRDELFHKLAVDKIPSQCWNKILKRRFFMQDDLAPNVFDENLSYFEDFSVMHRITFPVKECVYIHNCLYVYRQLDDSIVHNQGKTIANSWLGIKKTQERINFYHSKGINNIAEDACLWRKVLFCMICYFQQEKGNGISSTDKKRYIDCINDIKQNENECYRLDYLSKRQKIYLFFLLHHLMFIHKIMKKIKDLLLNK